MNVLDYLKSGDVGKEEIDNTASKAPVARLLNSLAAVRDEHYPIAVRLKDQFESVAYRRLVIDNENAKLLS